MLVQAMNSEGFNAALMSIVQSLVRDVPGQSNRGTVGIVGI